jgi:hypothetical protein
MLGVYPQCGAFLGTPIQVGQPRVEYLTVPHSKVLAPGLT